MNKQYLGDSVYIQDDGWAVTLTTEQGDGQASNVIVLEQEVIDALQLYLKQTGKV